MKDAGGIEMTVNGATVSVRPRAGRRLSAVLRDELGLTGVKVGCDAGDCGACTVLIDGAAVCACLTPLGQAAGRAIETVEGLDDAHGRRLRAAFLRQGAAQCGICTPGMLMAASALLRRKARPNRADVEDALGGVLCRCTGYRMIVDAVLDLPAPDRVRPGPAVGQSVARLDGCPKLTGSERFGADLIPDDALAVRAVRSPHAAAGFSFGDIAAWGSLHGVEIFTAGDVPGENRFSVIPGFADQPAIAEARVRMTGEPVAVVAGPPDIVEALDLATFPVAWRPEAPLGDPETARAGGARRIHGDRRDNILIAGRVLTGDPDRALATAAYAVSLRVETPHVEHAYIEPEAGVAWIDGDVLIIRACTQAPVMDRDDTARILGLPRDRLRVIPAATGGGFGSKLDLSLQPLIGLVALRTGRPARMVYSRRESMVSTTKRHPAIMNAAAGIDSDGRITAMAFDGDFDTGAYSSWGPTVAVRVPVHASGPYRTPNYRAEARAVHTNGPVSGAFRGFGVPQAAIMQEALFDELAYAGGLDRLEIRRQNALQDGDRSVCGQVMQGVGIGACLDALTPAWKAALDRAAAANARDATHRVGVGIGTCWYGCGNTALPNPSTIRLGLTGDGRLVLHQGATDIGQGSNTVITQICSDALGLPLAHFDLVPPDTALTPDCGKTSASRQTVVTGKAALLAGQALRARILSLTNIGREGRLELDGAAIVAHDGRTSARIDLGDLPEDLHGYALSVEETYDPPTEPLDADGQGRPYAVYGYGAQIAEVAVDMALGTIRVHRITAAHDLGRVINPTLAKGQIEGGIAQGLGMALMEEYLPGRTENLHDYLIPTFGDMPEIRSILIEVPDPEGPFGAKGLGEHVLIPTAPAVLNAIRHATGIRMTRLPVLPHRMRAAIREAT